MFSPPGGAGPDVLEEFGTDVPFDAQADNLAPILEDLPNGKVGLAITMAAADLQAAQQQDKQPVHLLQQYRDEYVDWLQQATREMFNRLAAHKAAWRRPETTQRASNVDPNQLPFTPAATPRSSATTRCGPRPGTSIWRSCAACTDSGPSRAARRVNSSRGSAKKHRSLAVEATLRVRPRGRPEAPAPAGRRQGTST